ncbi:MAG: glycosyltransferase [Candidatus Gracilibacteria bacterium]|jgi:GT2 family glycosyltransferase|nr:glycosyltransferase [Candidatus Gracilibacteria bacterium]
MKNKLSIIILFTFDHEYLYVKNILKWILNNKPALSFDVIVVSNGNKLKFDKLKEEFAKESFIKFILNDKNLGYGKGNHVGVSHSESEYFLIMHPDIELFKENLEAMVSHMDRHKDIGILAPQLIYEDGEVQDVYRRFPSILDFLIKRTFLKKVPFFSKRLFKYLMHDKNPELISEVDWVVGALILVRRSMYDMVGGFDKRYFLFMSDTDLCREFWLRKFKVVYYTSAKFTHYHKRLSSGGIISLFTKKALRIHVISAIKYFWKYKFKKVPHITPEEKLKF